MRRVRSQLPLGSGFRRFTTGWEESMAVKPIPEGYHSLNAYLAVNDAAAAIEY